MRSSRHGSSDHVRYAQATRLWSNFCVHILLVSVPIPIPLPHFALYSVNKYFTVSAKTITKALKPEYQAKASRRFITEVKAQTFKNGELTKAVDLSTGKQLNL